MNTNEEKALHIIHNRGGIINTQTAIDLGIQPRTLYSMRDRGIITPIARGLYRIASLPEISNPDIVTIALKYPKAVLCLVSALSFHELTTQIPNTIHIALEKGAQQPRLKHPPLTVYRFSTNSYNAGIEKHIIDGVTASIYSPEKTLVDCFKFRNKIGMDVFLEALKLYKNNKKFKANKLMEFAETCRVVVGIKPYLESAI